MCIRDSKYTEYKQEFLNRWDCNLHLKEKKLGLVQGLLNMFPNVDKTRSRLVCINQQQLKKLQESSDRLRYRKYIKYVPA